MHQIDSKMKKSDNTTSDKNMEQLEFLYTDNTSIYWRAIW